MRKKTAAFAATLCAALGLLAAAPNSAQAAGASASQHRPHLLKPQTRNTAPAVIPGPMYYHGGPVENAPRIYVDYWGWGADPVGEQAYLNRFLGSIGNTQWMSTVGQYGGGAPVLAGVWSDPIAIPLSPTDAQIQVEAATAALHFGTGNSSNVEIVVATPSGRSSSGFGTQYCAYHGAVAALPNVTYTDLPYMADAGASCGAGSVTGSVLDGVSIVEGHELAEAITDPLLNAWFDAGGNEIGDKCAWTGLGTVNTSAGTFAVQPLWSNNANGCVM